MPIYEYHCDKCDTNFEYLVMGGREPEACSACNSKKIKRCLSACTFASKGAGGGTMKTSAGASSCSGCASSSCSSCGH